MRVARPAPSVGIRDTKPTLLEDGVLGNADYGRPPLATAQ